MTNRAFVVALPRQTPFFFRVGSSRAVWQGLRHRKEAGFLTRRSRHHILGTGFPTGPIAQVRRPVPTILSALEELHPKSVGPFPDSAGNGWPTGGIFDFGQPVCSRARRRTRRPRKIRADRRAPEIEPEFDDEDDDEH